MDEIIFIVKPSDELGFEANALGHSIFTQGESMAELKKNIKDAILCHFEDNCRPRIVRLHMVTDEVMAL